MRPCYGVCLVLIALVSLALGQEEPDEELGSGEELDFDDGDLSYDTMLAAEGSRKKKPAKGKCASKGGPKGGLNDQNTKAYTKPFPENKCPCWWDLTKNNCACCKEGADAMQCGWPMHRYCYKKSDMGCPGVCNNQFTLSGKGFPCHNDPNSDCAWCTKTGFQCFPDRFTGPDSKQGSRCAAQNQQKYCKSVQGDCRHISGACPPERCEFQGKQGKFLKYYECQCADGYTGNGLQCFDANGTMAVSGDAHVDLEMTLTSQVETFPFDPSTDLPTGVELQDLIDQMGSVDSTCSSGAGCTSSFNLNEINN